VIVQSLGNTAPDAVDDAYSTNEDTPLTVAAPGVLGNDTDPENDPLTVTTYTQPGNGKVAVNADGSFTCTPAPEFHGTDSFHLHHQRRLRRHRHGDCDRHHKQRQ